MAVVFNGKFFSAGFTAVHRVAEELLTALDAQMQRDDALARSLAPEILCPPDARREPELAVIAHRRAGVSRWQVWEQVDLPWLARGRTLVSLCNLAPIAARDAITMMHDAQVFSTASYKKLWQAWYQHVYRTAGRRHARILTVSQFSRAQLAHHGVAPQSSISVIPNGVDHIMRVAPDPSVRQKLGLTAQRYVVALANTLDHKNIRVLLRAFSAEALADVTLVLVGAATREDFAEAGHDAPAATVFASGVSNAAMRDLMEHALCVACPSKTEGFGLPPLEGMALGAPAVAAPCGALPEVCGDVALYADPDDPAAWIAQIRRLADDAGLFHARVQAGRVWAQAFTWARAGGLLADVLVAHEEARRAGVSTARGRARA